LAGPNQALQQTAAAMPVSRNFNADFHGPENNQISDACRG
jgi:hypothetical protein